MKNIWYFLGIMGMAAAVLGVLQNSVAADIHYGSPKRWEWLIRLPLKTHWTMEQYKKHNDAIHMTFGIELDEPLEEWIAKEFIEEEYREYLKGFSFIKH